LWGYREGIDTKNGKEVRTCGGGGGEKTGLSNRIMKAEKKRGAKRREKRTGGNRKVWEQEKRRWGAGERQETDDNGNLETSTKCLVQGESKAHRKKKGNQPFRYQWKTKKAGAMCETKEGGGEEDMEG